MLFGEGIGAGAFGIDVDIKRKRIDRISIEDDTVEGK